MSGKMTRAGFLKRIGGIGAALAVLPKAVTADATKPQTKPPIGRKPVSNREDILDALCVHKPGPSLEVEWPEEPPYDPNPDLSAYAVRDKHGRWHFKTRETVNKYERGLL